MQNEKDGDSFIPDPTLLVAVREAKLMLWVWILQSAVMIGIFILFGYNRTVDPFGLPLGLPGWYVFGGIIPSFVFLFVVIYIVRNKFSEVPLR